MSELTSLQLYQWITEEMGFFPKKAYGSSRSLLTSRDLDFLMGGRDLWNHVMKHVHSVSKAQHVRKNILLSRLKKNKFKGIQKWDVVGDKIHLLGEVKLNQAKLKKVREETQECEKLMKSQRSLLKMSGCQRHHLQSIADSTERRCMLLKMSGETIRALADALNYSSKCVTLGKAPKSSIHTSNIQHHSSNGFEEESANDPSNVPEIHPVLFECKGFLEKCVSMAKDLLDEKLEALNKERSSKNSFEFSLLSIESRFIDFDTLRVHNAISETKKNEFKSFINYNRKAFPANHLFQSLLSLISDKHRKMPAPYDDHYYTLQQKKYGMECINELECMLCEKLTHMHASVTHDFTVAAQDKVVTLRMTKELKELMLCMEKDLNEMFPDDAMKERVYELIEIMHQEVSVGGTISYINKSLNGIVVETSDNSPVHQMKNLDKQLKTKEDEMVCLRKALKHLQRTKEEIIMNVKNNYEEVRKCIFNVNLQNIMSALGGDELLVDLTRRELTIFNEYPLECHKKSLFLGREVLDSVLLMNGHMLGGAMCENAMWLKLTLGMAPYSSTEHILAALLKAKGFLDTLSGPAMLFARVLPQSGIAKIPEVLNSLEEDENKSEAAIMEACNFIDEERTKTGKEIEETYSIHNTWLEGKINKCVPERKLFDGKTFLQWYYEKHSLLQRKELL